MSELFEKYTFECADLETMYNCHTFVSYNYNEDKWYDFEVSSRKNESKELYKHLLKLKYDGTYFVGFNNIGFDYPVVDFFMKNYNKFKKMDGVDIAIEIHEFADNIINQEERNQFAIWGNKQEIKQIDLMRLWSFTNKARMTSLKMLEFVMRMDNIEELPFSPHQWLEDDEIQLVLDYNFHDVKATTEFFKKSIEMLEVREIIGQKYNADLFSVGDVQLGEKIVKFELEKRLGKNVCYNWDKGIKLPKQSIYDVIEFKDILFPYIEYESETMNAVLDYFKRSKFVANQPEDLTPKEKLLTDNFPCLREDHLGSLYPYMYKHVADADRRKKEVFDQWQNGEYEFQILGKNGKPLKKPKCLNAPQGMKSFLEDLEKNRPNFYEVTEEIKELNIDIQGEPCVFGLGGVHYCVPFGIYEQNDDWLIIDSDVGGFYPTMAVKNKMFPQQYNEEFVEVYEWLLKERAKYPKKSPLNLAYKLAANALYGKSSDKYSVFYDKRYTYQTTINGQLSIMMLVEKALQLDNVKVSQINTDGATFFVHKSQKETYFEVCKWFEEKTKLELEHVYFDKVVIRDVNNFAIRPVSGKPKLKGAYEYDINKDYNYQPHKNHSNFASVKAAEQFLLHDTPIEEFLRSYYEQALIDLKNTNLTEEERKDKILDFCLRTKVPRKGSLYGLNNDKETKLNNLTRYFVSNSDKVFELIKRLPNTDSTKEARLKSLTKTKKYNDEILNSGKKKKLKEIPKNKDEENFPWLEWSENSIEAGHEVEDCSKFNINDTETFKNLNLDYYIEQTKKLCTYKNEEPLINFNLNEIEKTLL